MRAASSLDRRLDCSTISFRHLDLEMALTWIRRLGFDGIDLGSLPGVCDHVPHRLDARAIGSVIATVRITDLQVRSINADVGDLNRPLDETGRRLRDAHLDALLSLAAGSGARAVVLPCGALDHTPVRSLDHDIDLVAAELIAAELGGAPDADAGCFDPYRFG